MNTRTATRTFAALMLTLGVAGAYARQEHGHVKMTFSGTNVATTIIGTESTYYYARPKRFRLTSSLSCAAGKTTRSRGSRFG